MHTLSWVCKNLCKWIQAHYFLCSHFYVLIFFIFSHSTAFIESGGTFPYWPNFLCHTASFLHGAPVTHSATRGQQSSYFKMSQYISEVQCCHQNIPINKSMLLLEQLLWLCSASTGQERITSLCHVPVTHLAQVLMVCGMHLCHNLDILSSITTTSVGEKIFISSC